MDLHDLLVAGRTPTVLGVDDGPGQSDHADLCGVICQGTRLEGLVWGRVTRDGDDATRALLSAVDGKFRRQLHAVLTDGLTFCGLNVVDLPAVHAALGVPCVAVLRRRPDREAFDRALRAAGLESRVPLVDAAGPVHELGGHVFQVVGASRETTARLLDALTDRGRVPEPLRLAHLIAGGVARGTSGRRA
ncbi:MAG: DUF99 family protein [Deltaproteobacteria bacterium]|nr:MAG: DUF99 family protein [Deltaproteobacteria bacterium]